MRFSKEVVSYLDGQDFSNGLKIKISEKESNIRYRLEFLENLSVGKSIVHIGFADHLPLIHQKIKKNTWLHKRLMNVASNCFGIDINPEVVEFVQKELNVENVYCLDVINDSLPEKIKNLKFDYLILGEVLEHIDNPVEFLSSIRRIFVGIASKIIITVPNAWDLTNLRLINSGIEFINTDHRYWFTPYTLAKVGIRSGLKVDRFYFVQNYPVKGFFRNLLLKRIPNKRETVLMIFDL